MGDWLSWMDGATSDHAVKARNEALKEVAIVGGSTAFTAGLLGAMEGYNHAKDPVKGGIPMLGPFPLDGVVGLGGLLAAVLAGEKLGETGQLVALGAGLGGAASMAKHYGQVFGAKMYKPVGKKTSTDGYRTGALKEKSNLSPATQKVYDEFMKSA